MYFFLKNQAKGCGCGCGVWGCQGARDVDVEYGGVRVQGMCPHEFYLGTCTCIKLLKQYTA